MAGQTSIANGATDQSTAMFMRNMPYLLRDLAVPLTYLRESKRTVSEYGLARGDWALWRLTEPQPHPSRIFLGRVPRGAVDFLVGGQLVRANGDCLVPTDAGLRAGLAVPEAWR